MSIPAQGGSYIRRKDGTLERVAFTEPQRQTSAPDAPSVPPATDLYAKPKPKD